MCIRDRDAVESHADKDTHTSGGKQGNLASSTQGVTSESQSIRLSMTVEATKSQINKEKSPLLRKGRTACGGIKTRAVQTVRPSYSRCGKKNAGTSVPACLRARIQSHINILSLAFGMKQMNFWYYMVC